jgi:ABC-type hemin transport system substrate-binding protein
MNLRIFSPSAAGVEIVTALGEADRLVGAGDRPHVVIVDQHSDVAAAPGARVFTLAPTRVAEIEATIVELAAMIGASARAPEVIESIQKPIESVLAAVINEPRPAVLVATTIDPPVAAGRWVPEMIAIAGGRAVVAEVGAPDVATSWAAVQAAAPDLVVIASPATRFALPDLGCRVVAVDGGYYTLPVPRVAYGIVQLGFLLHPTRLVEPRIPLLEVAS